MENTLPDDLIATQLIYDQCGFNYTHPLMEAESSEYGAHSFKLNGLTIKYRIAKITPTKVGQFVTLWKRNGNGPILPFDRTDDIDFVIISVRKEDHFGQFIFPKSALIKFGILTSKMIEGKRAFRVYPPWDVTTSKQAQKSQQWQLEYFLEIPHSISLNIERARILYSAR